MTHSHDTATPALSVESGEITKIARETAIEWDRQNWKDYEGDWVQDLTIDIEGAIRRAIAASPAPNPSPAAKGEEAVVVPYDDFHAAYGFVPRSKVSPDQCLKTRLRALLRAEDLAHADEAEALATPSPQPADAVREALRPFAEAAGLIPKEIPDKALLFAHYPSMFGGQTEIRVGDLRRARAALASDPAPSSPDLEALRAENEAYRNAARDMLNNWRFGNFYAPQQPEPLYVRKFAQLHKAGSDRIASQVIARSQAASDPATAGEAVEPLTRAEALDPLAADYGERLHDAPEDTARLRGDLERVTRAKSHAVARSKEWLRYCRVLVKRSETAERDRDDARKALETVAEDCAARDNDISVLLGNLNWLEQLGGEFLEGEDAAMVSQIGADLKARRAAARSASREGGDA